MSGKTQIERCERREAVPDWVIGPLGERLTMATLPSPETSWWNVRRKAEIVAAVDGGLLTRGEACDRYGLGVEEVIAWQRAVERWGWDGLRVTRVQHYRALWERESRY